MLGAVNAVRRTITDYGPDPHNPSAGLIEDIRDRLHGFFGITPIAGGDVDPGGQFFGYGPELQDFIGAANPAATNVVYADGATEISDAITDQPMGDATRRIFADRLKRGGVL